jgi:hypothetical protein
MKKNELERQNRELRQRCERLAFLLRSVQTRALGGITILEQGLQTDDTCIETGSEQVARREDAMKQMLAYLARMVDPAARTQSQADRTVQQLKEKGLHLADALKQYGARLLEESLPHDTVAGERNLIEKAMAQAMGKIALYIDDPNERCDFSPLTEALDGLREAMALVRQIYQGDSSQVAILLKSLIEAAEELIVNMCEDGEAYDDRTLQETFGQLYSDVQRLHAAIAIAKEYLIQMVQVAPVYQMPYSDNSGRTVVVRSMDEFTDAALKLCAIRFASHECHDDFQEALVRGGEFENRVDFIGTTVDTLIPDMKRPDELLLFVAYNAAFFTEAPVHYASGNSLAPAAIVYEQLYQYTFNLIEDNLDEILAQATQLLAERQRLEDQLTKANQCDVCGQEPWTWFWDPFASTNPLLFIVPEKAKVPVGAFAIGDECKLRLEEGETLSFTFGVTIGGQRYQASASGVFGQ